MEKTWVRRLQVTEINNRIGNVNKEVFALQFKTCETAKNWKSVVDTGQMSV